MAWPSLRGTLRVDAQTDALARCLGRRAELCQLGRGVEHDVVGVIQKLVELVHPVGGGRRRGSPSRAVLPCPDGLYDELEPVQRGVYGGAVGYLSFAGDMDVAIAIRTGVIKDQTLYVAAGAGVVADSVPWELEWKETEAKARAVIRAAEMVEQGL